MNTNSGACGRPARLLLVDDDRKFSRLLCEYFRSHDLFVECVFDGVSGLERARRESWDLVVLDVMLPNLDGFGVLRALRAISDVPVLMLTGRGRDDDRVRGLEGGADDYIPKVTSAREVLARVRSLLRRARGSSGLRHALPEPERVTVGALEVRPDSRQVLLAGSSVALTPTEYDLLEVLARNQNRVLARETLLERVRAREYDVLDRSIDVHIATLRRKLGEAGKAPGYIRTVRAAGYMLVDPADLKPS